MSVKAFVASSVGLPALVPDGGKTMSPYTQAELAALYVIATRNRAFVQEAERSGGG